MKKYDLKKILKYLLTFTLLCILLFYANSLTVNAASVPSSCIFYDNIGTSLTYQPTNVGRDNSGNISYYSTENSFTLTAGSYGGLIVCSLDTPVLKDKLYTLSVNFDLPDAVSTLSRKSILGLGANDVDARTNYINSTGVDIKSASSNNSVLSYVFVPNVNANYIAIPFGSTTTVSTTPYLRNLTISYQGDTNQLTSNDIQNIIDKSNQDLTNSIDNALSNCTTSNLLEHVVWFSGKQFASNGDLIDNALTSYFTDYISIKNATSLIISNSRYTDFYQNGIIFYDKDKKYLDYWTASNRTLPISSNIAYFRMSVRTDNTDIKVNITCPSKLDDTNKNLNDLKDDINNSNSSGATSDADNFFKDFTTDTFGLTSIITAPLNLISSLTSKTCSNLVLPLPYVNKNLTLPCLSTIYQQFFGDFLTIYQTITFGIVAYWVCIRIFNLVKDFKNPDHDEIEVMDL